MLTEFPNNISRCSCIFVKLGACFSKPSILTEDELNAADKLLKRFCHAFHTHVCAGKVERLWLCRRALVPLLEVTSNLRSCGPAW